MDKLSELKDRLMDEIKEYAGTGKLTKDDALTLKALTGAADHLCNLIEKDDGYSGHYPYMGYDGRGGSYARGRNVRRDSMGRYSGERGYSRNDLADKMRELMEDAPDERTRQEIQRLVDKMENT